MLCIFKDFSSFLLICIFHYLMVFLKRPCRAKVIIMRVGFLQGFEVCISEYSFLHLTRELEANWSSWSIFCHLKYESSLFVSLIIQSLPTDTETQYLIMMPEPVGCCPYEMPLGRGAGWTVRGESLILCDCWEGCNSSNVDFNVL